VWPSCVVGSVVLVCNTDRGPLVPIRGVPWGRPASGPCPYVVTALVLLAAVEIDALPARPDTGQAGTQGRVLTDVVGWLEDHPTA
jgi:hypothetical protein